MASVTKFELRGGETWRNPFSMYAALRDHDPVHHVEDRDFYVLTRFVDVWAAAGDAATFSSAQGLTVNYGEIEKIGMGDATPMVFLDPPEHTKFRALVTRKLTPRKVSTLEPAIRRFVVERIERIREMGSADIVAELFKPLPSFVVAHYLGVPAEDRPLFDRWSDAIVQAAAGGDPTAAGDPFGELLTYFARLVERRRVEPGDDIVSDLTALGEDTVTTARILGFAFTMVTGGNDTITGMLSGSACLLTENPDERAKLVADPGLIPNAVEELLRLTSPVQNLARTTTREVELHGVRIPRGKKVLLGYAAANRDDREFGPTAEAFEVERKSAKILTLSYGTHYCIGAAAARLQSRVVLEELLGRCPGFEVDVNAGVYSEGPYVRRHLSLPWTARGIVSSGMTSDPDRRLYAPATERNREAILAVLRRVLPSKGTVLEIASGTGEHAKFFAAALPDLCWLPSDVDAASLASIVAWTRAERLTNVSTPLRLDVTEHPWPVAVVDAIFSANMIHIAAWNVCLGLMRGAGIHIANGGVLVVYGPFKIGAAHTAPSNAAFDLDLRRRDPSWGVRDLERVIEAAREQGLAFEERVEMPANNQTLLFRRVR